MFSTIQITTSHRRRVRRRIRRLAIGMALAVTLALTILWLAFQKKPRWYAPAALDEVAALQAKSLAVAFIDSMSDRIVLGPPFTVVLKEAEANRWLAVLGDVWPETAELLPQELTLPAVRFEPGCLRAGAQFRNRTGWQGIVNVRLKARVSDDGAYFELVLTSVHIGAVPVPHYVLRVLEDHLMASNADHPAAEIPLADGSNGSIAVSQVDRLLDGIRFPNRFVWFNGQRPFRIRSIVAGEGLLRAEIEPLVAVPY